MDDDGDGLANCADRDCKGDAACIVGSSCGNGVCETTELDGSCTADCEICNDNQKNVTTAGTAYDCAHYSCKTSLFCADASSCGNRICEVGENAASCSSDCEVCDNGTADNDGDAYKDCADRDCRDYASCAGDTAACGNDVCDL